MSEQPVAKVTVLRLGRVEVQPAPMVYGEWSGPNQVIPVLAAAVEVDGHKILVDTGLTEPDRWSAKLTPHMLDREETLVAALSEIGWKCNDVDTVIHTHLHYDHCGNDALLEDARFYVSAAEWSAARSPFGPQKVLYEEGVPGCFDPWRFTFVTSDYFDVVPGVRIIQTPGHTPGHQSVLIRTAQGTLCVTGDSAYQLENFLRPVPPGLTVSAVQALDSIEKMRREADRLFISHYVAITAFQTSDFPESPAV